MYNHNRVLAIIPARGGSKRFQNKNIRILHDKPVITWTIEAAKKSKYIDRMIVSSDDDNIIRISEQYEAEVPFIRPKELSSDTASTIDVIFHAIDFFKEKGVEFTYVILLQPTSPLRTHQDIDNAFELLEDKTKSVISVCETEHPPLWSNTLPKSLSMKGFIKPELINKRSQDMPKYYRLNGAIYISEVNYLLQHRSFFGQESKAFIMPLTRSVDIDTEMDFQYANFLMSLRKTEE